MTIRELIANYQEEVKGDLMPHRAAEILKDLSALIGNCNKEIREADFDYNKVLLRCYEQEETANRAKIVSEISPEYQRKREAKDTKELVIEMIRSMKYYIRGFEEELQNSGNM